jgi:hypothetical protein
MLRRVVLTRVTQHNIPEDAILHSHRRENLKSYISLCHNPNARIAIMKERDPFSLIMSTKSIIINLKTPEWFSIIPGQLRRQTLTPSDPVKTFMLYFFENHS